MVGAEFPTGAVPLPPPTGAGADDCGIQLLTPRNLQTEHEDISVRRTLEALAQ